MSRARVAGAGKACQIGLVVRGVRGRRIYPRAITATSQASRSAWAGQPNATPVRLGDATASPITNHRRVW